MPQVSVVMPVYNGENFLPQAIDSILAQTFADFEFIIICEYGTSQTSLAIVAEYAEKDSRITVLQNTSKQGIAASLNKGLYAAKGDYIARMDGDDIALPERLKTQAQFMDENPDAAICASRATYISKAGKRLYHKDNLSENPEQAKADLLFFCFIHHPSVMFRKNMLFRHSLFYDETYTAAEDHELWCRASHLTKIAIMPEVLLKYRWHAKSSYHTDGDAQAGQTVRTMRSNLERLGIAASEAELRYLQRTTCQESFRDYRDVERLLDSFRCLILEKNRELKLYDEECLEKTLSKRMYWKHHRIRRWAAVMLKSIAKAMSNEKLFSSAIYLELNGFAALLGRALT